LKSNKLVSPFVKWVGGKRQLLTVIEDNLPDTFIHYYEPFVGGGAVLFHLQPKNAIINDLNEELINLYTVIKNNVDQLIDELKKYKNEKDYYYEVRHWDRNTKYRQLPNIKRAARIHYLNKTCYNGLYRVNSDGLFNTPFGRYKNPNFVNETTLRAVHHYLNENEIQILNTDYAASLDGINGDSFVYLDPPYDPLSGSSNFTGYNKGGFGKKEQERLKDICDDLNSKGVKFLLSNSATEFIKDLYKNYNLKIIQAKRNVNSKANKRGAIEELLVKNYEI